ncbi:MULTISPECIES: hypothetical protein [Streptomyces]|uniref:PGAP1-like protein n=1 Tax=Streptomyces griseoaurantiacus TaxID=68213 RepID=A0A1G7YC55_9ACTN|nr:MULTISPECIES: hypothetical protein [Streptomyces]MCL6670514.1 hypothetical protein [Streptomyces panaciradicis]SDG93560.1 hypothetical protein SAMN05216260_1381 [Streptomyces jietaisiensis]
MHIVGIHGIWQGNTNAVKLSADWAGALTKGLRTYHGPACPIPPLTVAYYGNLFRNPSKRLGAQAATPLVDDADPFTDQEEAFVLETLALYAPPGLDPEQLQTETLGPGIPYIPRPVAQAVIAVDHKIGRDMGRRLLGFVRQVYRYLHHDIGERIRAEVRTELHRPGPRLVIAHSLGSVIAFDMLTREDTGPGPDGLTALVTCGSPLAWPTIRHSLGQDGALELPDGIDWLNLHAAGDLVAQSGLGAVAPAVRDELVRNGITDPHTAVRYLEKQPLADLIVRTTTA